MSCDVGEATESLDNELCYDYNYELCSFSNISVTLPMSEPTPPSLYLRHSSFPNPSVASSTSKFILQPFFRFSYVTSSSLNSPGEPPMLLPVINHIHMDKFISIPSSISEYSFSFVTFVIPSSKWSRLPLFLLTFETHCSILFGNLSYIILNITIPF